MMSTAVENETDETVQVLLRIRPEFDDNKLEKKLSRSQSLFRSSSSTSNLLSPTGTNGRNTLLRAILDCSTMSSPSLLVGQSGLEKCAFQINDQTVGVVHPERDDRKKGIATLDEKVFTFDRVFSEDSSQEDIYYLVSAHVKAAVRGYNTTIFAYGSTGSGKSFTMTGERDAPGVIPRAITEIFSIIATTTSQKENDVFFYVRLSYVELYNNNFRNLLEFASKELGTKSKDTEEGPSSLSPPRGPRKMEEFSPKSDKIEVRESPSAGVFLAGHNLRIPVTSAEEALQLINKGNKYRVTSATQCNDVSSRSHAILTLHVESESVSTATTPVGVGKTTGVSELRLGKMHLVDLAGSERLTLSGAEGDMLIETQAINLSLTALGDVLSALSRNSQISSPTQKGLRRGSFTLVPVPYRNSKLTHLLKDSLGGNSKTIMIANIRTSMTYYQQTAVTLMYASRAKKIKNKIHVNRNALGDTGIQAVTKEIERLRARLDERSNEFEVLRHTHLKDAHEKETLKDRLQQLKETNEKEKKLLESQMSHIIHSQAGQLAKQNEKITTLQQSLQEELAVSQNRIAEQEQEIKWLKRALDESARSESADKVLEMQGVLDGVHSKVEELRVQNTALNRNLSATISGAAQIRRQYESKVTETDDLNARVVLLEARVVQLEKELVTERRRVATLEADLQGAETSNLAAWTAKETKLLSTIKDLEKDKAKLQAKLEQTITIFEQRTTATISKVTSTLEDSDRKYRDADAKAKILERDLSSAKSNQEMLQKCVGDLEFAEQHVNSLMNDLNSMKKAHAGEVQALEAKVKTLQTELKQREAALHTSNEMLQRIDVDRKKEKDQLSTARGEHKQMLMDLKQQFETKISSLKTAHDAEVTRLQTEREAAARKEQQAHATVLQKQQWESKTEMERALERMQSEVVKSQKAILESMKHKEEKTMKECIVLAEKKFEEAMNAVQLRHTAEQAALAKSWEDKIEKAGQDMEHATGDLQRLQAMFDKQVQELKDTNKKQAKTAKVAVSMVREEAKKEKEGLIRAHDDEIKVLREKHEQDIAQARMEVTRSQDQLAVLKDQWSKEQAARVRELEATHGKACEDLHMTYETKTKSTLTMLKEDYKQEMALATKANQEMLEKCVGDLEFAEQHAENLMLDLNSMKQTHAAEMQALVVEHTERREMSLRALRADLEEQLALNVAAKQKELQEAEKVWRAQREALESARDASDAQVVRLRVDLAAVQATLEETTQRALKDLADQESSTETAIQRMHEELVAESTRVAQDLQMSHAVEMNHILDEQKRQEELRRASLVQDVEDRQSKETQVVLEAQRIDLEGQHERALSDALTDHGQRHEQAMKAAINECRTQAQEALDAADQQATQKLAKLESSHLELSALLSQERDRVLRLETERSQESEAHVNAMEERDKEFDEQRVAMEMEHRAALSALQKEMDINHQSILEQHNEALATLRQELQDKEAVALQTLRSELEHLNETDVSAVKREVVDVTEQLEDCMKQLQAAHDECSQLRTAADEQTSLVEELKTSLTAKQARMDKLTARNAALEADVNQLTAASVAVETQLKYVQADVEGSKAEAEQALLAAQATHAVEVARVLDEQKRQEETRLHEAQAAAAAALVERQRAYDDRHAEDMKAAECAYQLQLKQELLGLEEQLSAVHATALAAQETLHQQHLTAVEEEHEHRVSLLRRELDASAKELSEASRRAETQLAALRANEGLAAADHGRRVDMLSAQLAESDNRCEQLRVTRTETEQRFAQSMKEARDTHDRATADAKVAMAVERKQHQAAIETLQTQHASTLRKQRDDIENSMTATTDEKLLLIVHEHEAELRMLEDAHQGSIRALRLQMEDATRAASQEVASLHSRHDDEMSMLRNTLADRDEVIGKLESESLSYRDRDMEHRERQASAQMQLQELEERLQRAMNEVSTFDARLSTELAAQKKRLEVEYQTRLDKALRHQLTAAGAYSSSGSSVFEDELVSLLTDDAHVSALPRTTAVTTPRSNGAIASKTPVSGGSSGGKNKSGIPIATSPRMRAHSAPSPRRPSPPGIGHNNNGTGTLASPAPTQTQGGTSTLLTTVTDGEEATTLVTSDRFVEEMVAKSGGRIHATFNLIRKELVDQHAREIATLTATLKKQATDSLSLAQAEVKALQKAKAEEADRFSQRMDATMSRLQTQSLESLETQRMELEAVRKSDREAAVANAIAGRDRQHVIALSAAMDTERDRTAGVLKAAFAEKDKEIERFKKASIQKEADIVQLEETCAEKDRELERLQASLDLLIATTSAAAAAASDVPGVGSIGGSSVRGNSAVKRMRPNSDGSPSGSAAGVAGIGSGHVGESADFEDDGGHELYVRQRAELDRLRNEAIEVAMRHQDDLTAALEAHRVELSNQRANQTTSHEREMATMKEQLAQSKERLKSTVEAMSDRQAKDLKALKDQREEFDAILQTTLAERDARHREAIRALSEYQENERQRVSTQMERERSSLQADLDQRDKLHALELQKAEGRWKDRLNRELSNAEEKHESALRAALADAQNSHMKDLDIADNDRLVAEERLQQVLLETSQQQHKLTLSLAKMRAQYESDKQLNGINSPEFQALEARRREMLDDMESSHREKEEAFRAAKGGLAAAEQRLKDIEEAWMRRRATAAAAAASSDTTDTNSATTTRESTLTETTATAATV